MVSHRCDAEDSNDLTQQLECRCRKGKEGAEPVAGLSLLVAVCHKRFSTLASWAHNSNAQGLGSRLLMYMRLAAAFWDIRTPEEHGEAYKAYFKNVPFAIIARNGPQINPDFMRTFQRVFTDKNAKVILVSEGRSARRGTIGHENTHQASNMLHS